MELDEFGRRIYSKELMEKVCNCNIRKAGWGWKSHVGGPSLLFVCSLCGKPSRYAAIEECEGCEEYFFNPFTEPRYACRTCIPD